jgi:hypothetical protein
VAKPKPTVDRNPTEKELHNVDRVEEMLSGERPTELPSNLDMARNIAVEHWRSLKLFLRGKRVLTTKEEAQQRWDICLDCPLLMYDETNPDTGKVDGRCPECGCFMNVKVHYKSAKCPIDKW